MNYRFKIGILGLLALILLSGPAIADGADWGTKWSNGFKVESSDKAFKLKFGGRIQADFTFASVDDVLGETEDGFEFRRARLFMSGLIYERIEFKAQYDFTGGDADFKDMYIGVKNNWGTLRFGHFKEYFSLEELTSSKYLAFIERSSPIEAFSPSRNSGIGVHGKRGDQLNWGFGLFYDADGFGVSTDEDKMNITGRVAFRPLFEEKGARMIHLGLSATQKDLGNGGTFRFRARPEAHFTDRFVNTGSFGADSAFILDLEVAGVFGPIWFSGEYLQANVDSAGSGDPTFGGYSVQVGYYFTGEHRRYKTSSGGFDRQKPLENFLKDGGIGAWEVALRISHLDLNDGAVFGGEQDNYTLALNWYLNPATRMMVNYVHADVDQGDVEGDADHILLRWQVDF